MEENLLPEEYHEPKVEYTELLDDDSLGGDPIQICNSNC
jgi:hypothetical protein